MKSERDLRILRTEFRCDTCVSECVGVEWRTCAAEARMAEQRAALVQRDPELRGQRGALVGGGSEAEQGGTEPPAGAPKL